MTLLGNSSRQVKLNRIRFPNRVINGFPTVMGVIFANSGFFGVHSIHEGAVRDLSTLGHHPINCGRDTIGPLPFYARYCIFDASILVHLHLLESMLINRAPTSLKTIKWNGLEHTQLCLFRKDPEE